MLHLLPHLPSLSGTPKTLLSDTGKPISLLKLPALHSQSFPLLNIILRKMNCSHNTGILQAYSSRSSFHEFPTGIFPKLFFSLSCFSLPISFVEQHASRQEVCIECICIDTGHLKDRWLKTKTGIRTPFFTLCFCCWQPKLEINMHA